MKKAILFLIIVFALVSCKDDVKFNNPSFEGQKDNEFWRAVDSRATLSGGSLSIQAYTRNEIITLKTASVSPQTYTLGTSDSTTATYVLTDGSDKITFSTGNGFGDGEIVITEYDILTKTVSGTFKFNAKNVDDNSLAGSFLNFQYGQFYKVPVR